MSPIRKPEGRRKARSRPEVGGQHAKQREEARRPEGEEGAVLRVFVTFVTFAGLRTVFY